WLFRSCARCRCRSLGWCDVARFIERFATADQCTLSRGRLVGHNPTMIQDSANASPPSIRSRARIAEEFALRMRQRTTVAQGIVVQSLHLHVLLEPPHVSNCARKGRKTSATTAMNVGDRSTVMSPASTVPRTGAMAVIGDWPRICEGNASISR